MTKLKLILITMTVTCLISGCKPKQILPEPTQEGLNTFGVKIDGKVWLPVYPLRLLGGPKILSASIYDGNLAIEARKKSSDEAIILIVSNVRSEGTYKFKEDDSAGIGASRYDGDRVDDEYFPFPGGINEINITRLDTSDKIVSGNFKVQLKGKNRNGIKNFTDGTFDLKL